MGGNHDGGDHSGPQGSACYELGVRNYGSTDADMKFKCGDGSNARGMHDMHNIMEQRLDETETQAAERMMDECCQVNCHQLMKNEELTCPAGTVGREKSDMHSPAKLGRTNETIVEECCDMTCKGFFMNDDDFTENPNKLDWTKKCNDNCEDEWCKSQSCSGDGCMSGNMGMPECCEYPDDFLSPCNDWHGANNCPSGTIIMDKCNDCPYADDKWTTDTVASADTCCMQTCDLAMEAAGEKCPAGTTMEGWRNPDKLADWEKVEGDDSLSGKCCTKSCGPQMKKRGKTCPDDEEPRSEHDGHWSIEMDDDDDEMVAQCCRKPPVKCEDLTCPEGQEMQMHCDQSTKPQPAPPAEGMPAPPAQMCYPSECCQKPHEEHVPHDDDDDD